MTSSRKKWRSAARRIPARTSFLAVRFALSVSILRSQPTLPPGSSSSRNVVMASIKRLMNMRSRFWYSVVTILALTIATGGTLFAQSLSYTSGQAVSPAYEGWEQDPDGSKYFVFGYMNKNWEEELDVPI